MIERLRDPKEFNASPLHTLSLSVPGFRRDGYWDGWAWPRIHSYVGVVLARAGFADLGFQWVARALAAHLGPVLPETLDPLADPVNVSLKGPCRLMGYNALNCVALVDIVGLRMWDGHDLTIVHETALPRLCVINAKWKGKRFDAMVDPEEGMTLFHHAGHELCTFGPGASFEIREISISRIRLKVEARTETWVTLPRAATVSLDNRPLGIIPKAERMHISPGRHSLQIDFGSKPGRLGGAF